MAETKLKNQAFTSVDLDAWNTWDVSFTNFTKGSATIVSKYTQIGKTVHFYLGVKWAANTSASGNFIFTLPVTSVSYPGTVGAQFIGIARAFDVTGELYNCFLVWASTTTGTIVAIAHNATYSTAAVVNASVPFTWTTNDELYCQGTYEAA